MEGRSYIRKEVGSPKILYLSGLAGWIWPKRAFTLTRCRQGCSTKTFVIHSLGQPFPPNLQNIINHNLLDIDI